jgi:hypothetical protein
MSIRKALVAVVVAFVLGAALGAALVAVQLPRVVVVPSEAPQTSSPTPTASPTSTPSPSSTPTATPTLQATPPPRTPTPCPRPTSRAAGDQLLPYYFQARSAFPIFPSAPQIDLDEPFCEANPEAQFRGLTPGTHMRSSSSDGMRALTTAGGTGPSVDFREHGNRPSRLPPVSGRCCPESRGPRRSASRSSGAVARRRLTTDERSIRRRHALSLRRC